MAFATYCEIRGVPMIGLFATLQHAEGMSVDPKRIAEVDGGKHATKLPAFFVSTDQSHTQLRAAIETQHPL